MDLKIWEMKKVDEEFEKKLEVKRKTKSLVFKVLAARKEENSKDFDFKESFFPDKIASYKSLKDVEKAAERVRLVKNIC